MCEISKIRIVSVKVNMLINSLLISKILIKSEYCELE